MTNRQIEPIIWDQALIEKYNYSGPRYTSYPTALEFTDNYTDADFIAAAKRYPDKPLSLYVHIPFCHKLCYFCGCNKVITRHRHKVTEYLAELEKEIICRAPLFSSRKVTQMHWGGGTPTFLNQSEISQLMSMLRRHFQFSDDAELSLEIDPREIELDVMDHLVHEGFNRISIGIQDFNKDVQKLVNREQDEDFIRALILRARDCGIDSINLDLIYGLPLQTVESFSYTLEKIVELSPDRLSIFNYAHLPSRFAAQRKLESSMKMTPKEKLAVLQHTIAFLTEKGYQYIGMDHFAKPNDELAIAQRNGLLHRNFQGYTTQGDTDLLGLGVSAISMIGDTYSQNQKELKLYYDSINQVGQALHKGLTMSRDDCIRRDIIKCLICNFELDCAYIESQYHLQFHDYFAQDLALLKTFQEDELVTVDKRWIKITPKGHMLIRNICMCFDIYYRNVARQQQFSRVI